MKGAFQIAKWAEIPVRIHWSFALIFVWVAYTGVSNGMSWDLIGWSMGFMVALFVCVVLHEYGHALTARRFGVRTRDIILSPIGGIARLEKLPEKPIQEFYVAIAGPLVNVAIALVLSPYFVLFPMGYIFDLHSDAVLLESPAIYFVPALVLINVVLAIFNLLPAFPMDGGRILRALLSIKLGRLRATRIASIIGQVLAVGLFVYGIFEGSIVTAFIGVFVFLTATQEYRMVKVEHRLAHHTVRDIMKSPFTVLPEQAPMQVAIQQADAGEEKNFMLQDGFGQIVGVLHHRFIEEARKANDFESAISDYKSPNYEPMHPEVTLKEVLQKMQTMGYSILPVYEEGMMIGVVDMYAVNAFVQYKG